MTTETATNGANRVSDALAVREDNSGDIMRSAGAFEHLQRVAKMYASSFLIPEHLRGKIADVTIALAMARELGENPLVIMQSIYVVSGKAGWSATYMIARANRSGVFKGRIRWREEGKGENLIVTAFATLAETGDEISVDVSMQMATAEGWTRNAKYKSMPNQMLRYRSATMLIRLYAPEVMLGQTSDEVDDIRSAAAGTTAEEAPAAGDLGEIIDAEESSTPVSPNPAGAAVDAKQKEDPSDAGDPAWTDEQVGTHDAFVQALSFLMLDEDPDAMLKLVNTLPTKGYDVKSAKTSKAMADRRRALADFHAGKLAVPVP